MSSEANETRKAEAAGEVARQAPTEQQESSPGTPKRFAVGQTVCNEKNEKGKLCNGHLKQIHTEGESAKHLRGDDVLHRCQTCGALYMGPPQGHIRDPSKQQRYVEKDLAAILRAAGGTLPAYDYPTPAWRGTPKLPSKTSKTAATTPAATPAPEGETPEQKKARLVAEHKAKLDAKAATPSVMPAADSGADSSPSADRHRPAAEAQAATGAASAAPLSPAASTASPAAGAETPSDLSAEASTQLTPGAPRDERVEAAPSITPAPKESPAPPPTEVAAPEATPKPKRAAAPSSGGKGLPPLAPHLAPPPGETPEQKRERLRLVVEEAKRKAGKL